MYISFQTIASVGKVMKDEYTCRGMDEVRP